MSVWWSHWRLVINCVLFQFQASETLTWFKEAPQTRFGTNMVFMTFKNKVSFLFMPPKELFFFLVQCYSGNETAIAT